MTPIEDSRLSSAELRETWSFLTAQERREGFHYLDRTERENLFLSVSAYDQAQLLAELPAEERRAFVRQLPPDDAADAIQSAGPELRDDLLARLDEPTRAEVRALLAYAEDQAGGLMNPRFVRMRPEMKADEAITYLRKQTLDQHTTIFYAYVLDEHQRLLGVVSFRQLLIAKPDTTVVDIMRTELVTVSEHMDQAEVRQVFQRSRLAAIPVVDDSSRMKGIVTADDIVDVVEEEATRELQRHGGLEALDAPYMNVGFWGMLKKRGVWLSCLFLGELLTATAMGYYEREISRALVLALFIPLIISSGGNSGSQASTLLVRALALREVSLRQWWRVFYRELLVGLGLGALLGLLGLLRILLWPARQSLYGEHYGIIAVTIACSLLGVVLFGTLTGSMLPFVLRRLGLDPATASAPFVATLVDVTGLVIYFSVASVMLHGTLL